MPSRANGYRANKAQRVEVQQWRDILHTLRDDDWIRGYYVMQQIVKILGFEGGPMGGAVMPRVVAVRGGQPARISRPDRCHWLRTMPEARPGCYEPLGPRGEA